MNHFPLDGPPYLLATPFLRGRIRLSGTFLGVLWNSEVYAHIFQGESQFLRGLLIGILLDQNSATDFFF